MRDSPHRSLKLSSPSVPSHQIEVANNVEVVLPNKLREMLALSPSDSKTRSLENGRVVSSLVYGTREGNYNPSKGGEIWDVGEEFLGEDSASDDWEGEPVPWEVGELE